MPMSSVRSRAGRAIGLCLTALIALVSSARADGAPQLRLQLTTEAYAGMPIVLQVVADGFDESPAPTQPPLTVAGATVQALGVQPSVSQSIQIVNGRRYQQRDVRWVFEYRILIDKPGAYDIPALSLVQGARKASSQPTRMNVGELPQTDDMRLELGVPDRPLWVGERFPLSIAWLVRRAPQDQQFTIPMMLDEAAFQVAAPPVADPRQALAFPAGSGDVQLPYTRDDVDVGGQRYTRFTFTALVTPRKAGRLELAPAQVVARLAIGEPDFFGRSDARLFRALDKARSIEVKPLPLTGRPASFAGAVGESFSIATRASRTVVSLGEPVDLDVTIKSSTRLDALSLGTLDTLPKDRFSVPADPPAGVLSDDGLTKTFTVPVQVVGPANEIPAIAFAYFDPAKASYATVKSDPIALQVKGTAVVGAADVVGAAKPKAGAPPEATSGELSLVGADLALSSPGDALATPLAGGTLWAVLAVLYLLPLGVFGFRWWQVRTAAARGEASEVREARERVTAALARAAASRRARPPRSCRRRCARWPARSVARLARVIALIEAIELESFAPAATTAPLSAGVRDEVLAAMKAWLAGPRRRHAAPLAAALLALLVAWPARARRWGPRDPGPRRLRARDGRDRAGRAPGGVRAGRRGVRGRRRRAPRQRRAAHRLGQRRAAGRRSRQRDPRVPPRARDRSGRDPRAQEPRVAARPRAHAPAADRRGRDRRAVLLPSVVEPEPPAGRGRGRVRDRGAPARAVGPPAPPAAPRPRDRARGDLAGDDGLGADRARSRRRCRDRRGGGAARRGSRERARRARHPAARGHRGRRGRAPRRLEPRHRARWHDRVAARRRGRDGDAGDEVAMLRG